MRLLPSRLLRATVREAPRERREGGCLTKLVYATDLCSVPNSAWVITPELGHGSCLVGGWVNGLFYGDTPRSPKLLQPQVSLGWLRTDRGGSAPCRAACAQPSLVLPEKSAAASCDEKPHGVAEVPERMCCLTCGQVFGSREEQVSRAEQCRVGLGLA